VAVAVAVTPAAFAGLSTSGVFAWDGFVAFWVKNVAFLAWIVVMATVLRQAMARDGDAAEATAAA
jgi:hypothetical protein